MPHETGRLLTAGPPPEAARLTIVAAHGRNGTPESMLGLARHVGAADIGWRAPEADGHSWWPTSFLAPMDQLQPHLDGALAAMDRAMDGLDPTRTVLLGFSQGACLALEAAARRGTPLAAVAALSGGLVGTQDSPHPAEEALYGHRPKTLSYRGDLTGTEILVGCHERDPHIPLARVTASAETLARMGAEVSALVHPGAGHAILPSEIEWLRTRLAPRS